MSVKKDLLAEIDAKAKKIKERKKKASSKEELEKVIFDFFKEAEDLGRLNDPIIVYDEALQLSRRIREKFDPGAQVEVQYTEQKQVQGVLVTWSKGYQIAFQSQESFYIGVEQMLFS